MFIALLAVVALILVLPIIVRGVVIEQLARRTGRDVTLATVELNLFKGRLALDRFRLAQRDSSDPALEIERLDVRVAPASLFGDNVLVREVTITRPQIHVARLTADRYDFSDLLELVPPPDPNAKPSNTTVTVERFRVVDGAVVAHDRLLEPAAVWRIARLQIDSTGIGTRRGAPPGRLALQALVNDTKLAVDAQTIVASEGRVTARVTLDAFDLAAVRPYIPAEAPAAPVAGKVSATLDVAVTREADGKPALAVAGDIKLADLSVVQRARPDAFLTIGRVDVRIKEARPLARDVTLAAVEIDTLDLRVQRDAQGRIDLVALGGGSPNGTTAAPPASPAAAPATTPAAADAAPAAPTVSIAIERLTLSRSRATFVDAAVKPTTTLAVSDIGVTVEHLKWPGSDPVALDVALGLPAAGRLNVKGTATLQPFSVDVTSTLRGGSIEPYRAYIPIPARLAGNFNGDSRTRVSMASGTLTANSQGKSWIDKLEVHPPAGGAPPIRIARMEMAGIDFGWPTHAKVAAITITKPEVQVERDAAGAMNLRELFTVEPAAGKPDVKAEEQAAPTPAASPGPQRPKKPISDDPRGGPVGFPIDIAVFAIDDGYVRFLDRSVQPAFSESLSRLAVRVEKISTAPGQRANLTTTAIVGGDAALDVRGELAPLGQLYADIHGELRDFTLTRVNPYSNSMLAWIVDRGKLGIKFHYHVEKDTLEASNEVVVQNLHVQPSRKEDEVKKRIGLPLGMIVALITDADNGIKVNLPMSGPLASWKADISDAIWTVVKNAAVNIVAAPFRAIGRLFKGKDDTIESVGVNPVTFAPGSDTLTPEMQKHLTSVGDFLRRAPAVVLTLAPVPSTPDVESLRGQEVTIRLQQVQREKNLKDFPAAVTAEFTERFPGVAPPKSPDDQLAKLREGEPVPEARVNELLARRVAAIRDALSRTEGVPEKRLAVDEAAPPAPADGEGRVEFRVGS